MEAKKSEYEIILDIKMNTNAATAILDVVRNAIQNAGDDGKKQELIDAKNAIDDAFCNATIIIG